MDTYTYTNSKPAGGGLGGWPRSSVVVMVIHENIENAPSFAFLKSKQEIKRKSTSGFTSSQYHVYHVYSPLISCVFPTLRSDPIRETKIKNETDFLFLFPTIHDYLYGCQYNSDLNAIYSTPLRLKVVPGFLCG